MALTKNKYTYIDFTQEKAVPLFAKTTNAIATAADNQEDYCWIGCKTYWEHIQTGQNDAIQYAVSANGWTPPVDNADADGIEMTEGMLASTPKSFTVGTDPAFFVKLVFKLTTRANLDVMGVGFRKQGAYVDITTPALAASVYDDKALLMINSNAGNLVTVTSIGGTDTTTELAHADIADGARWVGMKVLVSAAGAVTYTLGTSATSAAAAEAAMAADANAVAMTITSGIIVVPYIPLVATGAGAHDFVLVSYECGPQ